MTNPIADTSALVSLGISAGDVPDPLSHCLERYAVFVPQRVIDDLREVSPYDDAHGRSAAAVLGATDKLTVQSVDLDTTFPLDDGENAAVTLANERDADPLLCDAFNQLGLIHALLADTRLVTTPTFLSVLVRTECLTPEEARRLLDIRTSRSREANSYVDRAYSLFDRA